MRTTSQEATGADRAGAEGQLQLGRGREGRGVLALQGGVFRLLPEVSGRFGGATAGEMLQQESISREG